MTFETWFTVEATDEAARMSRGWSYWPLFVLKNLYGIGVMLVLFFGGGAGVIRNLSKPEPDFQKAGLSLLSVYPAGCSVLGAAKTRFAKGK